MKTTKQLVDEYQSKSSKFPRVFTKEGQEYLGKKVASVTYRGEVIEWYLKGNKISRIHYFSKGIVGLFKLVSFKLLGYALALIPIVRETGYDILEDVGSHQKKYIYTGSSISHMLRDAGIKDYIAREIRSFKVKDKEKFKSKIKYYIH